MSTTAAVERPARPTLVARPIGDWKVEGLYRCTAKLAKIAGHIEQLGRWVVAPEGWGENFYSTDAERNQGVLQCLQSHIRDIYKVTAKIGASITLPLHKDDDAAPPVWQVGDEPVFDQSGIRVVAGAARLFSFDELESVRAVIDELTTTAGTLDAECSFIGMALDDPSRFSSERERDHAAAREVFGAARMIMRCVSQLAEVLGGLEKES